MAIRNDFTIDWSSSPRVITIASPSVECSMQDLHDTLRFMEAEIIAMDNESIVDSSGKETLDATTKVGITVTLQNAIIGFEARTGPTWTTCSFIGGNLVAVDTNGNTTESTNPTAYVSISKTSSASATLQEQDALQYSSYGGVVSVRLGSGNSGTSYPSGNKEFPVDNIADAVLIGDNKGFDTISIIGNITLDTGDNVDGFIVVGQNPTKTIITVNDGASTVGTEIKLATVSGILDGGTVLRECLVYNINYVNGFLVDCVLGAGTITLGGNASALFMRCVSGVPGLLTPIIDMGGSGQSLGLRDYNGGIKIMNKTGADPFSLDIASGQVILDSTVTNGTLVCRGVGKLKDFSTGTAVIIDEMLNGAEVANVQKLVELQSDSHSGLGKIWYWDPYAGDDTNEGDHVSRAVNTFAQAHTLARSGRGDIIIALTTDPDGHTVTTENIVISKDDIMVRGQGESFEINSANDLLDGVSITGHGVEVSGMTLSTSATSTKHCIYITGPNALIKDIILKDAVDGIDVAAGEYTVIKNVKAHHNLGYGIKVGGTAQHTDIIDCHIGGNGGDGIVLDATTPHEVVIGGDTVIHRNTGWGINISAQMTNVTIGSNVSVFLNDAGNINDLGTNTHISGADLTPISDAIANLNDFNPALDTVARVTLTDTVTSNTDKLSEQELHDRLDSYPNKSSWYNSLADIASAVWNKVL